MLAHYVPEVQSVNEWVDEDVAKATAEQLAKVEARAASLQAPVDFDAQLGEADAAAAASKTRQL
jgi:hypothetical protein